MDDRTKQDRVALPFEVDLPADLGLWPGGGRVAWPMDGAEPSGRSTFGPRLPRRFDARWSRRLAFRPQSSIRYRRSEVRKALRLPIEVVHPDWEAPEVWTTFDLSPTGAYVRSEREAAPGDAVVVSFQLPNSSHELSFFGRVVRALWDVRDDELVPCGFAVRFVDAGPLDRLRIREALRGIPPRIPAEARWASAG